MNNNFDIAYTLGYLAIPIAFVVLVIVTAIVGKVKRNKKTKNPRTEKAIQKELKELLNSEDGKVGGLLLAWCILTGCYIILGISGNAGEFSVWLQGFFILALLILAIRGRGRWFIVITSSLPAIMLFNYGLGSQSSISRISGAIGGAFYGTTALYFAFSKRAKKHFAWGQRKAELWLELEKRDSLGNTKTQVKDDSKNEPIDVVGDKQEDNESDIREQLKELKEQNKKLADKIDKLEKGTNSKKSKKTKTDAVDDYDDEL